MYLETTDDEGMDSSSLLSRSREIKSNATTGNDSIPARLLNALTAGVNSLFSRFDDPEPLTQSDQERVGDPERTSENSTKEETAENLMEAEIKQLRDRISRLRKREKSAPPGDLKDAIPGTIQQLKDLLKALEESVNDKYDISEERSPQSSTEIGEIHVVDIAPSVYRCLASAATAMSNMYPSPAYVTIDRLNHLDLPSRSTLRLTHTRLSSRLENPDLDTTIQNLLPHGFIPKQRPLESCFIGSLRRICNFGAIIRYS
jgi:hypothetical protein